MIDRDKIGVVMFGEYQHIDAQRDYLNGDVGFYIKWSGKMDGRMRNDILFWTEHGFVEIIGNIHDNPELLKEERK